MNKLNSKMLADSNFQAIRNMLCNSCVLDNSNDYGTRKRTGQRPIHSQKQKQGILRRALIEDESSSFIKSNLELIIGSTRIIGQILKIATHLKLSKYENWGNCFRTI